jgi:hypothetical protein
VGARFASDRRRTIALQRSDAMCLAMSASIISETSAVRVRATLPLPAWRYLTKVEDAARCAPEPAA